MQIKKFINRIKIYYQNYGLFKLLKQFISKSIVSIGLVEDIPQARIRLSNHIYNISKGKIMYGPLKGLILDKNFMSWSRVDLGSIILGFYEQEVLEELVMISNTRKVFIDVGAADGIFAVGLLGANIFDQSICFEIDDQAKRNILNLAKKNNLENKITIYDEASVSKMQSMNLISWDDVCLLVDIEGDEFDFITSEMIETIKGSSLIIEIHDQYTKNPNKSKSDLKQILIKEYDIKIITTSSRDLSQIDEIMHLHDNDRWLLCSEGRGWRMEWWVCEPKCN
ncbi:hypothetical protein N9M76_01020 [Gammaproteobacteria bacterium]|nr:hypothetical protein [Gammaproteobacteria bacterium]